MSLLESLVLARVSREETRLAAKRILGYAVRTPLIRLNYRRPDRPDMTIHLKLETLQPINSFKVRGAVNKIRSISKRELDERYGNVIVSASAGNMGQGVAFAAKELNCACIVVVPDHAPQTKLDAMRKNYGTDIVKVPFARWWEILMTGDASEEVGYEEGDDAGDGVARTPRRHLFVHPVCDPLVVAGNSTIGAEILEDLPEADAVFSAWGGGGCSTGIGSAVRNGGRRCDMISMEPATAAPLCYSWYHRKKYEREGLTPLPTDPDDPNAYRPSFIDGCGGKSVLKPMWPLAKEVLADAWKVELRAVEHAIRILAEKNRVIAEGAGACPVAAAMFGPVKKEWKNVVAVVCGGCIDTKVLNKILEDEELVATSYSPSPGFSFTAPIEVVKSSASPVAASPSQMVAAPQTTEAQSHSHDHGSFPVLAATRVRDILKMKDCIQAVEEALIAFADGSGGMPLRQVLKLPFAEDADRVAFLGTMPAYTDGLPGGRDYVSAKCISVYPENSRTGGAFSSHQGAVLLWDKSNHGEMLLSADAHEVTKIRTAAASAVATRAILKSKSLASGGVHVCRVEAAKVLAILGTGEQARSHVESMLNILPNIEEVRLWGRNTKKVEKLQREFADSQFANGGPTNISINSCGSVPEVIANADVICLCTSAREALLKKEHLDLLKPGVHINAIGACQPQFREISPEIFDVAVRGGGLFTDSVEACGKEPGDVLDYLALMEGRHGAERAAEIRTGGLVGIGELLIAQSSGDERGERAALGQRVLTIFKSLGIALEDLFAAKFIHENLDRVSRGK